MEINDEKSPSEKKKTMTERFRENPWIISTVVLGVLVVVFLINGFGITGNVTVSKSGVESNLEKFLELQTEGTATIESIDSYNDYLYLSTVNLDGTKIPIYITKDGKYLIQGLTSIEAEETSSTTTTNIPNSDKPVVELFVMSFCPYGVRAENNILPVIDLLKDSIEFQIRYIVNVNGDTISDVGSLHGLTETKENARQLVINKYYPDKFLNYIQNFNNNCYQYGQDETQLDACWKNEATKLGIDTSKVESLAYGTEGVNLLKAEEAEADKYSVSGSPTLIINGVKSNAIYSGTSATQTAICSAFNTIPDECSEKLSDSASTTSGSC
ncbi:MAG: DsbA family protein [Nanoarchaeota archaeon]|nr:DsbA family protein [Nanoarchaeota archaeon]